MATATRPSILLVDDDRRLTTMLVELLESEGYACTAAANGARGLMLAAERRPDLVVLDVMMPGEDGVATLARLRQQSDVPVIMLTALGDEVDRIRGLEAGADDYLAKPFAARELLLRVRAVLKRTSDGGSSRAGGDVREAGGLRVDPAAQRATLAGRELAVTGTELRILLALVDRVGAVVSREHLSRYAIGRELLPGDRTLDTHVSNLRRKLAATGDARCEILSVRGAGYRLAVS